MRELGPEEEWARSILQRELGVAVEQHDDGSEPAMFDLKVVYDDGTTAAVEVTTAADEETLKFMGATSSQASWDVPGLVGRWAVYAEPSARVKELHAQLPDLLKEFERAGRRTYRRRQEPFETANDLAEKLGVVKAYQGGTGSPGRIHLMPELPLERVAAFVGDTGDPLAPWLGTFLAEPERDDVRAKLANSDADEAHAFVVVPGFTSAPFPVVDVLMRRDAPLPTFDAPLPAEISHVWAAGSLASGAGFGWSPDKGWFTFNKIVNNREGEST